MKIIGLTADGFRKLTAIEMSFAENGITYIKGDNEQGKTSVIDTIYWLFKGKSVINEKIIQNDKTRVVAEIELEEYTIRRIQTEKSPSLQITNKDGFTMSKKPQAFLDKLVNDLTFDPFVFLNKTGQQKFNFLMDFFNVDTSKYDSQIEDLSEKRKYVKRRLKEMGIPEEIEKVNPVDIHGLYAEKQKIEDYNNLQESKDLAIQSMGSYVSNLDDEQSEIEEQIKLWQDKLKEKKQEIVKAKEELESLPTPEDPKSTEQIEIEINNANQTNEQARAYQDYLKATEDRKQVEDEEKDLTEQIKEARGEKKAFFTTIDTGVEGLELQEDGVFYKGTYSENWSDSESIRISANLCLSMNPELKAVFVDRGESFGKRRLEELEKWAKDNDIQVVLTKVDDEIPDEVPDNTYYIEEGKIVRGGNNK